jgi:hypothetical protein
VELHLHSQVPLQRSGSYIGTGRTFILMSSSSSSSLSLLLHMTVIRSLLKQLFGYH